MVDIASLFSPPSSKAMRSHIEKQMQMDIAFQIKFKDFARRVPCFCLARSLDGSGFTMGTILRHFFSEYANRLLRHGPDSFPSSFNVLEAFFSSHPEYMVFDLRPEREHLLDPDDYFDWYTSNDLARNPAVLVDVLQEGVIYSYDMASSNVGYRVAGGASDLVIAGISFVRHGPELSCLLVAGEKPPFPSDTVIRGLLTSGKPAIGRAAIAPSPSLGIRNRYLESHKGFSRVLLLTRFDVLANKHDVRYINMDAGNCYLVATDDTAVLSELEDEARQQAMERLARYDALFSIAATLIYLPVAFAAFAARVHEAQFPTELLLRHRIIEHIRRLRRIEMYE